MSIFLLLAWVFSVPIHNQLILDKDGQPSARGLQQVGPILAVEISVHPQLADYLQKQSQPVPAPISGQGLIDTGAGVSAVDATALQQLQIPPVGTIQVGTAGGQQMQEQFPARFNFPGSRFPAINFNFVIGANLTGQGIVALIGRDVLQHFVMIYNGVFGQVILSI